MLCGHECGFLCRPEECICRGETEESRFRDHLLRGKLIHAYTRFHVLSAMGYVSHLGQIINVDLLL